ncbi:MAG TPA: hypothetical protein VF100_03440, partial [Thermoanaerobaculia bacterium]
AAANVTLQASPAQVETVGGTVELLAVVRDSTGEPLADAAVNFQAQVGTLQSRGGVIRTDNNGQARDRLIVSASDIEALGNQNTFSATAVVGTASGTTEDSAEIRVNRCEPVADFSATAGSGLTVEIRNDSTGQEPLSFLWNFDGPIEEGDPGDPIFAARNPGQITYTAPGEYTIRLEVSNDCGDGFDSATVDVCEDPPCD